MKLKKEKKVNSKPDYWTPLLASVPFFREVAPTQSHDWRVSWALFEAFCRDDDINYLARQPHWTRIRFRLKTHGELLILKTGKKIKKKYSLQTSN